MSKTYHTKNPWWTKSVPESLPVPILLVTPVVLLLNAKTSYLHDIWIIFQTNETNVPWYTNFLCCLILECFVSLVYNPINEYCNVFSYLLLKELNLRWYILSKLFSLMTHPATGKQQLVRVLLLESVELLLAII